MTPGVAFTKMSGAGNDFLVLTEAVFRALPADRSDWVRAVCRRGVSVGADGVLVVSPARARRVRVVFYNPDGGEAFCGNGSRCAARFALARGLIDTPEMTLTTAAGDVPAVVAGDRVELTLEAPVDRGTIELASGDARFSGRWVLAGVPHLVIPVSGLAAYPLDHVGPKLRRHPLLGPEGANVDLVEDDTEGRVHVRTFERGVESETLACGTGAVAVAYAARLTGAPGTVTVVPRSGRPLTVTFAGDAARPDRALLAGDARFVFEGVLDREATLGPSP